jgi:hypothetical protein
MILPRRIKARQAFLIADVAGGWGWVAAKHLHELLVVDDIWRLIERVLCVKERPAAGMAFEAASEPGSHIRSRLRRFAGTTLPPAHIILKAH